METEEKTTEEVKPEHVEGMTLAALEQKLSDARNGGSKQARDAFELKASNRLASLGVESDDELAALVEAGRKAPASDTVDHVAVTDAAVAEALKGQQLVHVGELKTKDDEKAGALDLVREFGVTRELQQLAIDMGVVPSSVPDVTQILSASTRLDFKTKELVVIKGDGSDRLDPKTGEKMTATQLMAGYLKDRAHLVSSTFKGGTGQRGGSGGGGQPKTTITRAEYDSMSAGEQHQAMRVDRLKVID